MEINTDQLSELGKDLYLVGEQIFSDSDFLLGLYCRVSFSLQVFSSSPRAIAEGQCGSLRAVDQRSILLYPPRLSQVP